MRAQLGCNPDTAQPQRGRSSAAATASEHSSAAMQTRLGRCDRAHSRRSNNFSNESAGSDHGIRHQYALCRQCHRMLPLHHFLHLLRRDAHRCRPGAQVPTHDWRACRASDESDHSRWIATNKSERPLYVQQPSFSTTNVLELRPGLSCALVEGSRIASSQHSGWVNVSVR